MSSLACGRRVLRQLGVVLRCVRSTERGMSASSSRCGVKGEQLVQLYEHLALIHPSTRSLSTTPASTGDPERRQQA